MRINILVLLVPINQLFKILSIGAIFFFLQMNSFAIYFVGLLVCVAAQSNYDDQANSVEYHGGGLPPATVLDGKVTQLDEIAPIIFLNRTKAALNCAAGFMQVRQRRLIIAG